MSEDVLDRARRELAEWNAPSRRLLAELVAELERLQRRFISKPINPNKLKKSAMDRDELVAFAVWLLAGDYGEGHEEEYVDRYLAERAVIGMEEW